MPHSQLMNPKNVVLELKLVFLIIISRTLYCVVFFFFFYFFMQLYLWLYTVYFYCLITYQSWTAQTEQHVTFFNCKCYFLIFITPDQAVQQKCQLEG